MDKSINYKLYNTLLLQHLFGVNSKTGYKVFLKIQEENLLLFDIAEITERIDFTDKVKSKLKSADYSVCEKILSDCKSEGIKILTLLDEAYPDCLKCIYVPPLVLYYKGALPDFNKVPTVAIVGPRKISPFGKKAAFSLGYRLSRSGITVVSGGALGADTQAHLGAIKGEGKTVAVLGCGIASDYLAANKPLREKIEKCGCIISEYSPYTPASKFTFPTRNRIMSGLSLGVIVVEAGEKSGALITASHAFEQNRDVFVIPGNPTLSQYKGSNALFRYGAKPLTDANDIFNEYKLAFPDKIDVEKAYSTALKAEIKENKEKIIKKSKETLSKEGKIVYNYLDKQIFTVDDLHETGLSPDSLLSALTELELEGLISPLPGGKYKLI